MRSRRAKSQPAAGHEKARWPEVGSGLIYLVELGVGVDPAQYQTSKSKFVPFRWQVPRSRNITGAGAVRVMVTAGLTPSPNPAQPCAKLTGVARDSQPGAPVIFLAADMAISFGFEGRRNGENIPWTQKGVSAHCIRRSPPCGWAQRAGVVGGTKNESSTTYPCLPTNVNRALTWFASGLLPSSRRLWSIEIRAIQYKLHCGRGAWTSGLARPLTHSHV